MNSGSKGYEDGHYYNMTKEEAQMSKIVYDVESNSFVEGEGWRSWGCITALVQYMLVLFLIALEGIAAAILLTPILAVIFAIAFVIAMMFGYI